MTACNQTDVADRVYNPQNQPYEIGRVEGGFLEDDELIGRETLDLQAVGSLLERANNAEDLEYLLNSDEGINNLDLNDDGYADYISVREFDDRYDDERGFSLFSQFGPQLIQEIAQIILDRDGYDDNNYPGSRVLIRGDDYLYGDDYYYETDWRDRRVSFVDWVFTDRDGAYQSPYYYGNYPSYYEVYEVVETPVYLSRVEQYYYSPVFIQTSQPTVTEIRVDSPYREVSLSRTYMKAPKEQIVERQQKILVERNNQRAQFERVKPGRTKDVAVREDKQFGGGNPNRPDKQEKFQEKQEKQDRIQNDRPQQMRENPNREARVDRQQERQQQRFERQQQQQSQRVERQQQKVERQQQKVERQQQRQQPQQQRFERQNQPQQRIERPQQQQRPQRQENRVQPGNGGGNPNKGGGNPNKGGGGNPNKGGGGNGGGGGKGKGKG